MDITDYLTRMLADIRAMRQELAAMRAELEDAEQAEDVELEPEVLAV